MNLNLKANENMPTDDEETKNNMMIYGGVGSFIGVVLGYILAKFLNKSDISTLLKDPAEGVKILDAIMKNETYKTHQQSLNSIKEIIEKNIEKKPTKKEGEKDAKGAEGAKDTKDAKGAESAKDKKKDETNPKRKDGNKTQEQSK